MAANRPSRRQLLRHLVAAHFPAQVHVLGRICGVRSAHQGRNLILQAPLLLLHSTVAHRLALASVSTNLRPVDRQLREAGKAHLARQRDHARRAGVLKENPDLAMISRAVRVVLSRQPMERPLRDREARRTVWCCHILHQFLRRSRKLRLSAPRAQRIVDCGCESGNIGTGGRHRHRRWSCRRGDPQASWAPPGRHPGATPVESPVVPSRASCDSPVLNLVVDPKGIS